MKRAKNKNMVVLVVIVIVTLTSSIGYSALQSNLKVTADLNVLKDYVPDGTLYDVMHHISEMDNVSSKYVSSPSGIDFSEVSSDTNGKGVYELNTTKDEKYPIHYYRGEVDNNVIFANFCWKIIRTTETGGIKLIYNGEPSDDGKCDNIGTSTQIGTSSYNEKYDEAKYVGYKYDNDEVDSTIKIKIDEWYKNNIEGKYSNYLEDTVFCNDRSISGQQGVFRFYEPRQRSYVSNIPTLECIQESDKFTVSNGKLKYPVGLITSDETIYAGGIYGKLSKFYLKNNENYWMMSPSNFDDNPSSLQHTTDELDGDCYAEIMYVRSDGRFWDLIVLDSLGIRPVLSLKHETKYLSGNGSKETPLLITPITKSLYNVIKSKSVFDNVKSEYVSSDTGIDFSKISSDTNGKGVYELHTTKDDEHPIYYYRGAVTDNNIIFADFCWKIIRTTETGGIKLIYNGEPSSDNKCINTIGENTQIGQSAYNENYDESKYVGYKYDNDEVDSTIKTKIESWYKTNIDEKKDASGKSYTTYIEDLEFCNDKSISSTSGSNIYYGPRYRNYEQKKPSLECPQDKDKSTVSNKKLTYPVGLITADEVVYAGGVYATSNNTYYLYTDQWYWTISPFYFDSSYAYVWHVPSTGSISCGRVYSDGGGVRPVVNLSSNIKVTGGGTSNNPYMVQ